jgi:hypothetical protein
MTTDNQFEAESTKVADAVNNKNSNEAAEALSRELLSMSPADQMKFLKMVASKNDVEVHMNKLDLSGPVAHLWTMSDFQRDYVVVTPGQNIAAICKSDFKDYGYGKPSSKELNHCIEHYAKANKLENPDNIRAGQTLVIPGDYEEHGPR